MAGWEYLARIISSVWFPKELVLDGVACTKFYTELRPGANHDDAPTGLEMIISSSMLRESITHISPKTLGGKRWMQDPMYPAVLEDWSSGSGFAPFGPCVAFGFCGLQRKTVRGWATIGDADALMYLGGLVDYDLDIVEEYSPGIENALGVALRCLGERGRIQGMAIAGLLNLDIQRHNREIQRRWIAQKTGWPVQRDISPDDWVTMTVSDSASIAAFGSEEAGAYTESKLAMFGAILLASLYDLIYDRVTWNLATVMMYTPAAGMTQHNMHCICSISILDLIARRFSEEEEGFVPLYGDSSMFFTVATDVRNLEKMAKESLVLPSTNIADAWRLANTQGAEATLIPRMATQYTPSPAPEVAALPPPHLFSPCLGAFSDALEAYETDQIDAIAGLPSSVVKCAEVAMVAGIRRAALFASSANCCEVCACQLGCWADEACHAVMLAFMRSERDCSASEWGLRLYLVGCVSLTPVSVPSILSGFDLLCEVTEHEGAMGSRDVLNA
ncbi:hypothetical protein GGX14DRAFT_651384 [Mycena pura]|uniref:Uncharacterized protein n=1 Tax=Mycena pura TaxID=153505 RepID=A0AAD6YNS6_9AGAR|nr:hypothetical protein GGX14DRAFT_651384 [Mycena pura]